VERPSLENAVLRLHEELLDFAHFMKHTPAEVQARTRWVKALKGACRKIWPSCKVQVFGSFFTGISLPNGDVDMVVTKMTDEPSVAMKKLGELLLASGEVSSLELIEAAKVPVLKVRSQACGLRADVVFNQPDGIKSSEWVRDRLEEYPQMRPMIVFLKYFLLQRGLHETYTGGMGSYLLCNLVLHFCQRHPARWNAQRYTATSLGHLLFDFFKYYGHDFRYDTDGISVVGSGCTFKKAERGWYNNNRRGGLSLCLESPLEPSRDMGGACFRIGVLKNLFNHVHQCICHLFSSTEPVTDCSLLCPLLIDQKHPVITGRYKLMAEQPVALPGLPKASDLLADVSEVEEETEQAAAPRKAKRRRRDAAEADGSDDVTNVAGKTDIKDSGVPAKGVGAWIRGLGGDIWGAVVGDEGKKWRLDSGRICKKDTEGVKWTWHGVSGTSR